MRERPELVSGNGKGKGCLSWGERDASTKASAICKKCGAKRVNDRQLGSERLHDCLGWARGENCAEKDWSSACHLCRMVLVFRELRRVLRDDGTFFLNYGDSYANSGVCGGGSPVVQRDYRKTDRQKQEGMIRGKSGLKNGNLAGVPWRIALALQADGWILRQEIIWCLSGGTWLYVRSKKGDMPMMVRDMARLDPSTVKLWNGEKWTQLLGMNRSVRRGDEVEIVIRSGERISCTRSHKFPTARGLLEAGKLVVGDCLSSTRLPEPDAPKSPLHISLDAAWLAGLYLAEGSGVDVGKIRLAGHSQEITRWERVQRIVADYGGYCTLTTNGNNQTISVFGKVICALINELVSGHTAKDKGVSSIVWRYANEFLESYMDGYLSGDGHDDSDNLRWRLGFTRNYNLERDIRAACARLGWTLTLNPSKSICDGRVFPSFHGEIRKTRSGHHNEKDRCEVMEIRNARCREVYDIGVADEPHTFALASGVMTHNSKPAPMPESCTNRCTKAHEHIFLLTKKQSYFYDADAVRLEPAEASLIRIACPSGKGFSTGGAFHDHVDDEIVGQRIKVGPALPKNGPNLRSVWTIASEGSPVKHFATFPTELPRRCILAGTSERGCCFKCGTPWVRIVEKTSLKRYRPNKYVKRTGKEGTGNSCANTVAGVFSNTLGWRPNCKCYGLPILLDQPKKPSKKRAKRLKLDYKALRKKWKLELKQWYSSFEKVNPLYQDCKTDACVVGDIFLGSGTTSFVAQTLGRRSVGIDLSEEYLKIAKKRISSRGMIGRERKPEPDDLFVMP